MACKKKSSLDLDNIEYKMIKNLPERFKQELLERMNYAFMNSQMFIEWIEIQTIFINKKDKMKVRPISISSCVVKFLKE